MKLEKILDQINSFEKNSLLKIIDNLISEKPKNSREIDQILRDGTKDLKNADSVNISKVFSLLQDEYQEYLKSEFVKATSQLDIITDIIIRDGNCIMKQDWFARLYDKELLELNKSIKEFQKEVANEKSEIEEQRIRDYQIYKECLSTAYNNDLLNNMDPKVTTDERSILVTLARCLELSHEETKLINYQVIPIKHDDVDTVINDLKSIGVILYSKKTNTIYVPDEIVRILRKVRGKELADKFFRRVLRLLREPQINLICKKHNINWRLDFERKIKEIIDHGISFSTVLINDIHKEGTTLTEKKAFVNELCEKGLKMGNIKGVTIEEKINNLESYFEELEQDEKVSISVDGYEKLLIDLSGVIPNLNDKIKSQFEIQEENALSNSLLLDYNIKPPDILDLLSEDEMTKFCQTKNIKTRGDLALNIIEGYKDSENLYLENYVNVGCRNLSGLKENGIVIKEAELGVKFEDLTKKIFSRLGFNVDEQLRKELNTSKDKIDIVLNLGNSEVILIECKTVKESGYNKFSSVSRQLKSYIELARSKSLNVIKVLLISPEFSDEFVNECGLDYELNLSLIAAPTLFNILEGFKNSRHKQFPHTLLMRDVLIQEDRILKAIDR